jgi:hypothetical protein
MQGYATLWYFGIPPIVNHKEDELAVFIKISLSSNFMFFHLIYYE